MLTGLLVCGRCDARIMTRYAGKASQPSYFCIANHTNNGEPLCQRLAAKAFDDEVVRLALMAMQPSALEISLQVAADLKTRRDESEKQWLQRLERANYEAERAKRQYDSVEPENRLVARTLESAWEEKLRAHRELVEQHERFQSEHPQLLIASERDQIRQLASDLPALWNAPSTTDVDRKTILRQLIDHVEVNVEGNTEWVEARIRWAGGEQTYTRFRRPVARLEQLSTWPQLRERIARLKREGCRASAIAGALNRDGLRTQSGTPFTADCVRMWLSRLGLTTIRRSRVNGAPNRQSDEWLVPDLARELDVSYSTIYTWIRKGWIVARQVGGPQGRLVVRVTEAQRHKLTAYKRRRDGPERGQTPSEIDHRPRAKV